MAVLMATGIFAKGSAPPVESEKQRICAKAAKPALADSSHFGLRRPCRSYSPTRVSRFHFSRYLSSLSRSANGAFVAAEFLVSALYDSGHRSRNAAETARTKEGIDFIALP